MSDGEVSVGGTFVHDVGLKTLVADFDLNEKFLLSDADEALIFEIAQAPVGDFERVRASARLDDVRYAHGRHDALAQI